MDWLIAGLLVAILIQVSACFTVLKRIDQTGQAFWRDVMARRYPVERNEPFPEEEFTPG